MGALSEPKTMGALSVLASVLPTGRAQPNARLDGTRISTASRLQLQEETASDVTRNVFLKWAASDLLWNTADYASTTLIEVDVFLNVPRGPTLV